jgi:hypothetical protein
MKVRIKSGGKQNLDVLLDKLKSISTYDEINNRVNYSAFERTELDWIFLSIIDFGSSLSIESKKHILENSFKELVISDKFDKNYFIDQIEIQINKHNRRKEQTFYLLTTLSISNLPFRKVKLGDSVIRIHGKQYPKKFKNHRTNFLKSHKLDQDNNTYTKVSVEVRSKDFKDAYESSFMQFESFRAFLCLLLNHQLEIRFLDRDLKPINKVRQGIISTVHTSDGDTADENHYWYVPDYKEAKLITLDRKKKENIKKIVRWMISRYNKCKPKHQETIGKALVNYAGAFDESNKYICFIRLWTVLEILLNTDQNDLLIKRCTAKFGAKYKDFEKQRLEGLRLYRNEYVHQGDTGLDPITACFNVQFYIYNLILKYNLQFAGFFKNIEEANLFLDNYTPDLNELKSRRKILNKAISVKEKKYER